jgi:dTDP-4-dehydrorhamnose 3,5-epimerase
MSIRARNRQIRNTEAAWRHRAGFCKPIYTAVYSASQPHRKAAVRPLRPTDLTAIFEPLSISGAYSVKSQPIEDERGWFSRAFCCQSFQEQGISFNVSQANRSFNRHSGTVRGFHFQFPPDAEQKLLRCTRGTLVDVVVDLRPESPTYLQWEMVELSEREDTALLIPERCCHALQTQCDNTEIFYLVSAPYAPGSEFGLRWDDPRLNIQWPITVSNISPKDAAWPHLTESEAMIAERMALPAT